jgi:hypothetical protein
VPPLRLDALGAAHGSSRDAMPPPPEHPGAMHAQDTNRSGAAHGGSGATFSTRVSNLSTQRHASTAHNLSPRPLPRSSTLTPRAGASLDSERMPAPSGAATDRPAHRHRPKKRNPDMEYGSALLDRMQEEQRAARKRTNAVAFGDGSLSARLASPRRRKSGPPSSRDKVWDLLTVGEKEQILRDDMSAAEGTKARPAHRLHVPVQQKRLRSQSCAFCCKFTCARDHHAAARRDAACHSSTTHWTLCKAACI